MSSKILHKPKLIVILGSTASGKSKLSLWLANQFNGEIISADSRQIYKNLNIGTGKITQLEKKGIPHHLLDIISPDQDFSLAQYKKLASAEIKKIQKKGKLPFLVGGTGLYIQSIVDNLNIPAVPPQTKLRQKLAKEIKTNGLESVYQRLLQLDPQVKDFIDPHNPRRVIRALEICLITKKPFSRQRTQGQPLFETLQIGLKNKPHKLKQKIEDRTKQMIAGGLVKEVESLLKKYKSNLPALNTIGYQEIIQYLQKKISLAEAEELINLHTLQYAKRQMTWFKKDKRICWVTNRQEAKKLVGDFLS